MPYVPYAPDVETVPEDEAKTIATLLESMHRLTGRLVEKFGDPPLRVSHAKAHGVAVGTFEVLPGLPPELAQGLFAQPKTYDAVVRLANVPGEITTDDVATQRGLSCKVLGVEGERLGAYTGASQDFVFDSGDRFSSADAKEFLGSHLLLEHGPQIPAGIKATVSAAAFEIDTALHAFGADSSKADFFGSPRVDPVAESYFSQTPYRYGEYVAKFAFVPVAPAQVALEGRTIDVSDADALRKATVAYLREHDAEFEFRVQLRTDAETMPIEDATKRWEQSESPFRTVARLRIPRQEAFSDARRTFVDQHLSFCVSHALAAHRPLGGVNRARLVAYPALSSIRNGGSPMAEPRAVDEVPA